MKATVEDLAAVERRMARALDLLARDAAWLEASGGGYAVRVGRDRRRRPVMRLDAEVFAQLCRAPGLKTRLGGGWALAARPFKAPDPPAARPSVVEAAASAPSARVNLGESPIAWLARRRDAAGRPWLTPVQAAAGERLREDFHHAGLIGRLTMNWDSCGRGSTAAPRLDPAERGVAAKRRVQAALDHAGPDLRPMLEHVCLRGTALEAAERALDLPRRSGKTVLRLALQRLAEHYRMA